MYYYSVQVVRNIYTPVQAAERGFIRIRSITSHDEAVKGIESDIML